MRGESLRLSSKDNCLKSASRCNDSDKILYYGVGSVLKQRESIWTGHKKHYNVDTTGMQLMNVDYCSSRSFYVMDNCQVNTKNYG